MALPNFFSKAALSASQILQGYNVEGFQKTLESSSIGVAFDNAAIYSREGRTNLELLINLLARLYPRIAICCLDKSGQGYAHQLADHARAINADVEIADSLDPVTVCITVGETPIVTTAPVIYLGSDGWVARLRSNGPVASGNSFNPFGASAAACFGAANVFRAVFGKQLTGGDLDIAFDLSLIEYFPCKGNSMNPPLEPTNLGEIHLVGIGAIGSAAIWALSRIPNLNGILHLIDPEPVELSNLQRYVLTKQVDVGQLKVDLATHALEHTGLHPVPHRKRWEEYLAKRGNWDLQRVAVAVDSAADRCAVQASLPRWVANAWTQTHDLGVSRHGFLDEHACLVCLYLRDGPQPNQDEIVAGAIGLPDAKIEVRKLLALGNPIGEEFVKRIAAARNIPFEKLERFASHSLPAFYSQVVCGGIFLSLGEDAENSGQTEVPMAFQSALAGVMLAAEIVCNAANIVDRAGAVTVKINLLRPLGTHLSLPAKKHPSGNCICQDPDYIAAFQAKYKG